MHWVIQDKLYREEGMDALLRTLGRFSIPHNVVSVDADGAMAPDVMPQGAVMICGTYMLARIARERGWEPGTFWNVNHEHRVWVAHYGARMLNVDAVTSRLADVRPPAARVFIRPAEDNKFFAGQVMDANEVEAWRDAVARGEGSPVICSPRLGPDTLVTCGPALTVYRECRFFVVDAEVVAGTTYRIGADVVADPCVDPEALTFARRTAALWQPARGFALDVALTPVGYRVVEINCINMAGFYGADVQRIVMALEAMEFEPGNIPDSVPSP